MLDRRGLATYNKKQGLSRIGDSPSPLIYKALVGPGEDMAKYDKLIITGEMQQELDATAVARVVILLARKWWQAEQAKTSNSDESSTMSAESEVSP
jgi:hypothetical protein